MIDFAAIGYGNALNYIAYKLYSDKFNFEAHRKKIAFLLQAIAGMRGSAIGLRNAGYCLIKGNGVKQDPEKAAIYLKRALDVGYLEAKEPLDQCYDMTFKFK